MVRIVALIIVGFFGGLSQAEYFGGREVSPACPVDDPVLLNAVANGQQVACQILYFPGRTGTPKTVPRDPLPKSTIEEACIDAETRGCGPIIQCIASSYYKCWAHSAP